MGTQPHRRFTPHVFEELALLLDLLKWSALATLTGGLIGLAISAFAWSLQWVTTFRADSPWRLAALPLGGLASGWLIYKLAPDALGHGTEQVIRAVHKHHGRIRAAVVPIKAFATLITLGSGGSAGKEGPAAQIGSGLASIVAGFFRLSERGRRKLCVCGISAGFAGIFGLPIAGSIFGIEVLAIGLMFYDYLLPSFVAGVTCYEVTQKLGAPTLHAVVGALPDLDELTLLKLAALGLGCGIVSLIWIEALQLSHRLFGRVPGPPYLRPALGGLLVAVFALVLGRAYLGLSMPLLTSALAGSAAAGTAFLWKILFTAITVGSGGSGGVITPSFVIGATFGAVAAPLLGLSPALGAAMGMVGLVAGATNTPIAATIMSIEMFGSGTGVFAAATCIVAFLISGHRSLYPSQIIAVRKTEAVKVELNRALEDGRDVAPEFAALRPVARTLRFVVPKGGTRAR